MCFKVMMMAMVVMVMPVSPRPHQVQQGMDKIEKAVSESFKGIETAIMGSAKKIEIAIEETVLDKLSKESVARMEQGSSVATNVDNNAMVEVNAKKNAAVKYIFAKIIAARKAAALKGGASPSLFSNVKAAAGDTTTTTTEDPLAEYCKEACETGYGGPECDCPDHPIG